MPGSGKGIKALLDGKVPPAGVSRPLKDKEINQDLVGTAIAHDAIAIFVNSNKPIISLTKEQLKAANGQKIVWRNFVGVNE